MQRRNTLKIEEKLEKLQNNYDELKQRFNNMKQQKLATENKVARLEQEIDSLKILNSFSDLQTMQNFQNQTDLTTSHR